MYRRIIYIIITLIVLTFSFNYSLDSTLASSDIDRKLKKLEQEEREIKQKTNEINRDKREINEKMDENKKEQMTVQEQLDAIEAELVVTRADIQSVTSNIRSTEKEINSLENEISQLNDEIEILKERIDERNELLKERLRSLQESGGKSRFLSVLLGAQNFTDFIMRTTAVNTIMDQDRSIMEEHEADQNALANKRVEVETKKSDVESKRDELEKERKTLEGLQAQLDEQKAEQSRLKKELEIEYAEMEDYKLSLEEENEILEAQALAIEKAKALAEKERTKQNNANSRSSSANKPIVVSSDDFVWPVPDFHNITSSYGYRPKFGRFHHGIDIGGSPARGANVVAVADGYTYSVETRCREGDKRCGGRYGNRVFITHNINGETYTTVYAHLDSVTVGNGQFVRKGQPIGTLGNTGDSTGPHLHFEIHKGKWNLSKTNALDPKSVF